MAPRAVTTEENHYAQKLGMAIILVAAFIILSFRAG